MRDTRLSRKSVEGLSEDERLWKLMEPAWDHEPGMGTHGQQMLALTAFFIRDIGNGGLDQAIYNFSPAAVDFILKSFDALGATEHADAVRQGLQALFGPNPPRTLEARRTLLESRSRDWLDEHINPLSERLYDEGLLYPYYQRYIDANPSEFFRD
jgi:hypothetical protein